jgi:hypothetical protein
MTRADILKLLAAVAALVGIVALVLPPTKPVPAPAGDWRKQIPVKTGTPPPAASTVAVPPSALIRKPPPPKVVPEATPVTEQPGAQADRDDRYPPEDPVARRFRQGYLWAERNSIDDEQECYREEGDPFTDGCLAAVTDPRRGHAPRHRRDRYDPWWR